MGKGNLNPEPGFNRDSGLDANRGQTFKSVPHLQQKPSVVTLTPENPSLTVAMASPTEPSVLHSPSLPRGNDDGKTNTTELIFNVFFSSANSSCITCSCKLPEVGYTERDVTAVSCVPLHT